MSNLTADAINSGINYLSPIADSATVGQYGEMLHTALSCMRECAERRDGCEFCKNFDFSGASAKMDSGKYPHIHLAGGSYRYPRDEQFDCCPKCGRKRERSTP